MREYPLRANNTFNMASIYTDFLVFLHDRQLYLPSKHQATVLYILCMKE